MKNKVRSGCVDLGCNGGPNLKQYLESAVSSRGISLNEVVERAYEKENLSVIRPYDTVKPWISRKAGKKLVLRIDRLEPILKELGCKSILEYPFLPSNEKARLVNRENNQDHFNLLKTHDIVDLSYEINTHPSCSFLLDPVLMKTAQHSGESVGVKFTTTVITQFSTNYGTHIDFPGHLPKLVDNRSISKFPLTQFILDAVVVDVRDCVNKKIFSRLDENHRLPADAFGKGEEGIIKLIENIKEMKISKEDFLSRCDQDIKGKAVLFCTGLDRFWQYSVQPGWRYAYFLNPFITAELAHYFVEEGVALVGSDSLQLECPLFNISPSDDFPGNSNLEKIINEACKEFSKNLIHEILLERSIFLLENLRNLRSVLFDDVTLVAVPIKFGDPISDNSPTRAFALTKK